MRYMIRESYNCQRGKVPEYMEHLKVIVDFMKSVGLENHTVYVDISGRMDTVYHEYEVGSLDEYFASERGFFVDMDADSRRLVDAINGLTVSGQREIFEILI